MEASVCLPICPTYILPVGTMNVGHGGLRVHGTDFVFTVVVCGMSVMSQSKATFLLSGQLPSPQI